MPYPINTNDGPSGSGKGTISRLVADRLGWRLLDSGALYRLVGYAGQRRGLSPYDESGHADVAQRLGPASDDLRFESGRRLLRRLRDLGTPKQPQPLELVSLFDADDRLVKSSLRRLEVPRR